MRSISLFVLLIFFSLNCFCQENNKGKAIYNFEFIVTKELTENKSSFLTNTFRKTQQAAKHISIILNFNGNETYSYIEPNMDVDNLSLQPAIIASGYKKPIYTNLKEKEVLLEADENLFPNKKYIIELDNLNTQWHLTKESKTINGYHCYKANGTYTIVNNSKTNTYEIIAWYSPDIPLSFGPLGYGNLPGMIVELQLQNKVYRLKEITLDKKKKMIKKPDHGERITNKEYQEMVKTALKSRI